MHKDIELQGLVKIIEEHLQNKGSLKTILDKLEKEGFSLEKLSQAAIIATDDKEHKKHGFFKTMLHDALMLKPLVLYVCVQFVFFILAYFLLNYLWKELFKSSLNFGIFLIFIFIGLIGSTIYYVISAYVLHFVASFVASDNTNNTYKNSLWILFWVQTVSLYLVVIFFASIHAQNIFLLMIMINVVHIILIFAAVSFYYIVPFGKAFMILLYYAIALFFVETILVLLLDLLILTIGGFALISIAKPF